VGGIRNTEDFGEERPGFRGRAFAAASDRLLPCDSVLPLKYKPSSGNDRILIALHGRPHVPAMRHLHSTGC